MISVGYSAGGKRVRKTVYGWSKAEVQEKLIRLQSGKLDGTLAEPTRFTVAAYLDHWLENVVKASSAPATHVAYKVNIKRHINKALGGIRLSKLCRRTSRRSIRGWSTMGNLEPSADWLMPSCVGR